MERIRQWAIRLCNLGEWVGVWGIMVMVVVSCADVLGAKLFMAPVPGSTEIISLVQVVAIVFAVAPTQRHRGHISVEMFVATMSPRVRSLAKAFTSGLGAVLFALLVYESVQLGNEYLEAGEVTATAQIPFYPFAYAFSVALLPVAILLVVDCFQALKKAVG
jgi:TRAP-type C4-dicarboxylate transport system permease small subunit